MKSEFGVTISVPGTFHAFQLASQLDKRDALNKIFATSAFSTPGSSLPAEKVRVFRSPEILFQIGKRAPVVDSLLPTRWGSLPRHGKRLLFDKFVEDRLKKTANDLFLGFAGNCRRSLRRANRLGYTTIVERSSSHIAEQRSILLDEYDRLELDGPPISKADVEWENQEYKLADYVVVPSEFAYNSFVEEGFPEEKLIRIPLGVTPEKSRSDPTHDGQTKFLYVGGVSVRKGVQYLLQAWDEADVYDVTLSIVGGIDSEMRWLVDEYEDEPSVNIHGWVSKAQLSNLYQEADAFLFPSLEDGFGRVVLEAMTSGLPVVVTQKTGAKDCVRHGKDGFVIPDADVNPLKRKIEWFASNPEERSSMGDSAARYANENYTWDHYGEKVYNQYRELV